MNLYGPREAWWSTHTGILECQVQRRTYPCLFETTGINSSVIYNYLMQSTQGDEQGCVAMTTGILAGLWDLLPCTNTSKYICKHLAAGAVVTVPPPTQAPPKCEEGWSRLGTRNYCVKVQPELPQNSAANIKSWGGHFKSSFFDYLILPSKAKKYDSHQ